MPYNVRLKKYKNGTFQLTYYHRAIRTKEDYWRPYNLPDLHTTDYDDEDDEFDIDKWIELKQISPFDMSYDPLQVTEIGSEVDEEIDEASDLEEEYISPEEAASRRERSLISSLNRSKRMIYDYGRANKWEWFFTLTFDPVDHFDEFNFSESKKKVSNGDPLTGNALKCVIDRLKISSEITRLFPYLLRHTFGTSFCLGGGNLEILRLYMGHSSIETTQGYLHLADNLRFCNNIYHLDPIFFVKAY